MIEFPEAISLAHSALDSARIYERDMIDDAVGRSAVVRVFSEPEVGTTSVVSAALAHRPLLRLDLDAVAGPGDVGWLLARGLAHLLAQGPELSLLAGPAIPRSPATRELQAHLQEHLGSELTSLALSENSPDSTSEATLKTAMTGLERVLASGHPRVTVWIDHLEAPGTTPRHPLSARDLLWQFRALRQAHSPLQLVVSGRSASRHLADDRDGALFGDGLLLTFDRPSAPAWDEVCHRLSEAGAPEVRQGLISALSEMTEGHPATMLQALCDRASGITIESTAQGQMDAICSRSGALISRAVQHARTLHRLGTQVLTELAWKRRPYRKNGLGAGPQEINRALQHLHQGGLITRHGRGSWSVTNPVVAMGLRGGLTAMTDTLVRDSA